MTIEQAIQLFSPKPWETPGSFTGEAFNLAFEALKQARWIPCSERMPDLIPCNAGTAYSETVIVWTDERKIMAGIWNGFDWIIPTSFWEAWGAKVTHWRPIYPPKEEQNDER